MSPLRARDRRGSLTLRGRGVTSPSLEGRGSLFAGETRQVAGHVGAAGYYEAAMFKFLRKHREKFEHLLKWESKYPNIFYWTQDGTFKN